MVIYKETYDSLVEIFNISTKENKPVIFPTDTIYGIGANIVSKKANLEIYKLKNRPSNKPFPILAGSIEQLEEIADISSLTQKNYNFLKENYNKCNTFILPAKDNLDEMYKQNSTVAIRIPDKKILSDMLAKNNMFITATSVNESGKPFINSLGLIIKEFKTIDLFVYGSIRSKSSNIYDISKNDIIQIR